MDIPLRGALRAQWHLWNVFSGSDTRLAQGVINVRVKAQKILLRNLLVVGLESVEHENLVPGTEGRMSMFLMFWRLHRGSRGNGDWLHCSRDTVWFYKPGKFSTWYREGVHFLYYTAKK